MPTRPTDDQGQPLSPKRVRIRRLFRRRARRQRHAAAQQQLQAWWRWHGTRYRRRMAQQLHDGPV